MTVPSDFPGGAPQTEQEWKEQEMQGFEMRESAPWKYFRDKYGDGISKEEIISLGQVCSMELKIKLVREFKRRKETMVKWFHNHWSEIQPFLDTKLEVVAKRDDLGKAAPAS
jgi:hypothetical protein